MVRPRGSASCLALALGLLLSGGCGGADRDGADTPPAGGAPGSGAPTADAARGAGGAGSAGPWVELPYVRPAGDTEEERVERGVGVVYLPPDPWGSEDGDDTLVVRSAPSADADTAALFVRDSLFTFHLLVRAGGEAPGPAPGPDGLQGLAFEFGYEELGLAAHAPPRDDGWTPVRVAAAGPDTLGGWVRVDEREAGWLGWEEQLRGLPVFLVGPVDSTRFRTEPGGATLRIPLGDDYILHPIEVRGPWMRVEVVRPSDYCFEPRDPARDTAWVRYLDEGGRPTVWYFTRGC